MPLMVDRPRVIFDCSEELRTAITLRSVKMGWGLKGASRVITSIMEEALQPELAAARQIIAGELPAPTKKRKPKS